MRVTRKQWQNCAYRQHYRYTMFNLLSFWKIAMKHGIRAWLKLTEV